MAIVARRLIYGVSARRFGLATQMDIAHTTICCFMVIFTCAKRASRKAWYADREQSLYEVDLSRDVIRLSSDGGARYRVVLPSHRGDAGNTNKFKVKYHTEVTHSWYYEFNVTDTTTWAELMQSLQAGGGDGDI